MSVFETNYRHLRKVLIFCFHLKKTAAEAHQMLSSTYGEACLSERTCSKWFQRFKSGDYDVEDRHPVEKRKFSKISNWRHYLLKTRAKRKKNCQNHWEWLNKPFVNALKPWEWFRSKEIGFRTSWSQEMLNGVSLLANSCFKDRIGRGFYIVLWPATKNGSTTKIPSAENHGECPDMPPRRRQNRIFTVPRLCSAFGRTSSVWCIMSCWNQVTGDPSNTRRSFSRNMKSSGKRALSTWVCSWIEGLASTNTCRSRLPKPSNVEPLWLGSCPTLVAPGKPWEGWWRAW